MTRTIVVNVLNRQTRDRFREMCYKYKLGVVFFAGSAFIHSSPSLSRLIFEIEYRRLNAMTDNQMELIVAEAALGEVASWT
jgi:hypothetical protein